MESPLRTRRSADPITVLLVASRHVGWTHVRQLLAKDPLIRVVGDVSRADEAVQLAQVQRPDLVLTAAGATGAQLRDVVHGVAASSPASRVVVLTDVSLRMAVERVESVCFCGLIAWQSLEGDNILSALEAVLAGFHVTSPELSESCLRSERAQRLPEIRVTDIEERVLTGLLADRNQREIAEEEAVGIRTVRRAASRLKRKYHVRTLWGLVRQAVERGYRRDAGPKPGTGR